MSGSARKIKSKARRKNMRAWKRKKMFDLMAAQGEYQHPDILIDGIPMKWHSHRFMPMTNGGFISFGA